MESIGSDKSPGSSFYKGVMFILVFFLIVGSAFFGSYGGFGWWEAWLLVGLWVLYFSLMLTVVRKTNPGVVEERSQSLEKISQRWDRAIIGTYQVISLSLYVIAGLDVGRFGWSGGLPDWLKWLGFSLSLFVYLISFWAIISNPFASGVVRIQGERGHQVFTNGPYRYIRHPMYLGTVVYGIGFPLFLESFWALIPGVIVIGLFVLRTSLEDRYLHANLPGYREYARQTRYRLLPGIW
jgi:protein-S-isoprenylcysteine O-methyltransferase Ste14